MQGRFTRNGAAISYLYARRRMLKWPFLVLCVTALTSLAIYKIPMGQAEEWWINLSNVVSSTSATIQISSVIMAVVGIVLLSRRPQMHNQLSRIQGWLSRHYQRPRLPRSSQVALGVIAFILLSILAIYQIPLIQVEHWKKGVGSGEITQKDLIEQENSARAVIVQLSGGMLAILGIVMLARRTLAFEKQVRTIEDGHITERYTKAVEQLGHEKPSVQLGGIFALERIARESPEDHWTIMEVLTGFLRDNYPAPDETDESDWQGRSRNIPLAIADVIRRRKPSHIILELKNGLSLNLRNSDLREANLEDAKLEGANLQGSFLSEAKLQGATLSNANLQGANLQGADLKYALLDRVNLAQAVLTKANLERVSLRDSVLMGANLRGANLSEAVSCHGDFRGAVLSKANLISADLEGANLDVAEIQGAKLWGANLRGASLDGANLQNAELKGANLTIASLHQANLTAADLLAADLEGANLWSAQLQGADLFGANLKNARLWSARLQGANLADTNLQGADLSEANLQGVSLINANLKGASLEYVNLEGADLQGANVKDVLLDGSTGGDWSVVLDDD